MFQAKPLDQCHITQPFGANFAPFYKQMGLKGHQGLDCTAAVGTPCYAVWDGTVSAVSTDTQESLTKGRFVNLRTNEYEVVYFHLQDTVVKVGDKVTAGQLLGHCDNTGQYTTGSHLHFAVYPLVNGQKTNLGNGYGGAVDPEPFFQKGWLLNPTSEAIYGQLLSWEGRLIREEDTSEIYLVKGGKLLYIPDEVIFWTNGFTFTRVDTVSAGTLEKAPKGDVLKAGKAVDAQILKEMLALFKNEPTRAETLFTKYF